MNKAVADDYEKVVNNSDGLGKVESISNVTLEEEEQEPVANVEEGNSFSIPLSIFHYKDYNSDFFTSWYNISSEIFKEINRACPEKKVLNLALSVLVLPYIAFTAMGLVIYSRFKADSKTQTDVGEDKTKKGETSVPKRLAYGALAAMAIFVNVTVFLALIVPATVALTTFYLLNRELSHSLVTALKISMGLYSNEHQNIEVSFHEKEVPGPNIAWDMEIKFPPQFKRLLRGLCENENNKWFNMTQDSEHNVVLKLSTKIDLKNGLKPLRNEIKDILATSIQEFAKAMEELMKLEKKDITYDKLEELLSKFRLKVVNSIDSKLTTHLIESAYRVAFIQAIKFAQKRREEKEDFSLEERLKEVLVEQELRSQGKELPNKKEIIIEDLKNVGIEVPSDLDDSSFPTFKAKWKEICKQRTISKRYPNETKKAEESILNLRKKGNEIYTKMEKKLRAIHLEIYQVSENNNSISNNLKRKLEDIFKFKPTDRYIYQELIESRIRKAKVMLNQSDLTINIKQSLLSEVHDLDVNVCFHRETNLLLEKMYLEITRCRIQSLLEGQAKSIKDSCNLLKGDAPDLVEKINLHRTKVEWYLKESEQLKYLKDIIKGNKKLNKYLEDEQNSKGEEHPNTKLIEQHLKNNQKILKALENLESEKEGLLINEETKNNYREELESREKIKFAIIEDKLLEVLKKEIFDEKEIKKLFGKAELEYCLAERCIKGPVTKTKDNIKHFCQDLLSPLIDRLVENIINNVPKNDKSSLLQPVKSFWTCWGYIKTGLIVAIRGDESTEGKALDVAHNSHKEVETFLEHFESSYEKAGAFLGDLFSDEGETFKNDVWPKIEEHLHGMWDRFFKDIEFTLVKNRLDEASPQQLVRNSNKHTVIAVER